jgi:hypothetical protein
MTSNLQKTLHHEVMHHIQFTKLKTKSKIISMLLGSKGTQIEQTWLNPLWPLCKKLHNFLSFYLINLKPSRNIASRSDTPYPIYKTKKIRI